MTENQIRYAKILNQQLKTGKISKKKYKKEIEFIRSLNNSN